MAVAGHQLFLDTANYFCTDGYTASNNSKVVCNAQGLWAPPEGQEAPRCIANFCQRPPDLPHAILDSINKPKYASNTEVSYKCEEGFVLNTTATLKCLKGGEWAPSPYDVGCVPVRCTKPMGIERGYVSGTNYSFGAMVAYSCDKGFLIRGEKRRTCKANGEWGGVLPTCQPVACSNPPPLKNGFIQVMGYRTLGNIPYYNCVHTITNRSTLCTVPKYYVTISTISVIINRVITVFQCYCIDIAATCFVFHFTEQSSVNLQQQAGVRMHCRLQADRAG